MIDIDPTHPAAERAAVAAAWRAWLPGGPVRCVGMAILTTAVSNRKAGATAAPRPFAWHS